MAMAETGRVIRPESQSLRVLFRRSLYLVRTKKKPAGGVSVPAFSLWAKIIQFITKGLQFISIKYELKVENTPAKNQ